MGSNINKVKLLSERTSGHFFNRMVTKFLMIVLYEFYLMLYINIVDDDKPWLSERLGGKVSQVGVWPNAQGRIWSEIHSNCEHTRLNRTRGEVQICTESAFYCKELDMSIGQDPDGNPSTLRSSPTARAWITVISAFLVSHKSINIKLRWERHLEWTINWTEQAFQSKVWSVSVKW